MYAYLTKLFVALVFVLHGTAPAATHVIVDNNRIIGGIDASYVDTGFMVYLITEDQQKNRTLCGGSIINEQTILTAAHCIENALDVKVYAGTKLLSRQPDSPSISVAAVHSHPDYDPRTVDNDIALLRLAAPLTFNSRIRAIKLAEAGERVIEFSLATVFGWGRTKDSGPLSSVLLYTIVRIMNRKSCEPGSPQLCADVSILHNGACHGDSGGPLVQDDKVIGVASAVVNGCGNKINKFARVAALRSWVDQTLAEHYHEKL